MHKKKQFFLNGQKYIISENLNLEKVLNYFNYQTDIFVIEYNKIIYNQNEWKNLILGNNDKIEIITIVGGG